jgi:hypothetical protein
MPEITVASESSSDPTNLRVSVEIVGAPDTRTREAFWQAFWSHAGDLLPSGLNSNSPQASETAVVERLGFELRRELLAYLGSEAGLDASTRVLVNKIAFRVVPPVTYGSMLFGLELYGAGALLTFFGNHPDLLVAFLTTFVPDALVQSVAPAPLHAGLAPGTLSATVTGVLIPAMPAAPSEISASTRAVELIGAAGRFAVPALLLIVALVYFIGLMTDERGRLATRLKETEDTRAIQLKVLEDRAQEDKKRYNELLQRTIQLFEQPNASKSPTAKR